MENVIFDEESAFDDNQSLTIESDLNNNQHLGIINSYILVSDLHKWSNNLANRKDYIGEIEDVEKYIMEAIEEEISLGHRPNVFFLGDIYHRGFKSIAKSINANNDMVLLASYCDIVASVVGNHEITYKKDNPFWTLMCEVETEVLTEVEPKGVVNILRVPDVITDGEVSFYFNHYGTDVPLPSNKFNILLSHNDITTKDIVDFTESQGRVGYVGNYLDFSKEDIFKGYNVVYLGHEHIRYGSWIYTNETTGWETEVNNLGSLGRTNIGEVLDDFLERRLPIIRVKDGKYMETYNKIITLRNGNDSLDKKKIELSLEKRESINEVKRMLDYKPLEDDPLTNIRDMFADDLNKLSIIDCIINNEEDKLFKEIMRELDY